VDSDDNTPIHEEWRWIATDASNVFSISQIRSFKSILHLSSKKYHNDTGDMNFLLILDKLEDTYRKI